MLKCVNVGLKNKERILIEGGTETNFLFRTVGFKNEAESVMALHVDLVSFTNLKLSVTKGGGVEREKE